jgi:hypothetical protein
MNTVTISFYTTEEPLIFTGVTTFKYDPMSGNISIVYSAGDFNGAPENVANIYIN